LTPVGDLRRRADGAKRASEKRPGRNWQFVCALAALMELIAKEKGFNVPKVVESVKKKGLSEREEPLADQGGNFVAACSLRKKG